MVLGHPGGVTVYQAAKVGTLRARQLIGTRASLILSKIESWIMNIQTQLSFGKIGQPL